MIKNFIKSFFLSVFLLAVLDSCHKEAENRGSVAVTDIVISEAAISLREGDSTYLTATIYPENATNKNVVWFSSDGSTVSVDNGIIKAHRIGSATITVKSEDGGITAFCQVAVTVNYIAFETESGSNFAYFDRLYANLEYSDNNADWHPCEVDLTMPFGNGSKLYLRGYGNNVEDESHMIGHIILGDNTKVVCTGNIMTLLDYENPPMEIRRPGCFYWLFWGCTSLVKAPELPAEQLSSNCYETMFGCTSLREAPELPATQLSPYCYSAMFIGCTSLAEAPELPAEQLSPHCYEAMFMGCTSLREAPELPATQLSPFCYEAMFQNCESLVEAPELPATQLSSKCYEGMFLGCTSLETAPELPAEQLDFMCYSKMFMDCKALKKAPVSYAKQLEVKCCEYMFSGCTSLTEVPELSALDLAERCYSYMFYGCTSLKSAPQLPALNLAESCYFYMFSHCSSLEHASALPATKLFRGCYAGMFQNCESLTTAPDLPSLELEDSCYSYMFAGCLALNYVKAMFINKKYNSTDVWMGWTSSTGTFVKNRAATWDNEGVIPQGWTVELADE